jgi:hypothetical protein
LDNRAAGLSVVGEIVEGSQRVQYQLLVVWQGEGPCSSTIKQRERRGNGKEGGREGKERRREKRGKEKGGGRERKEDDEEGKEGVRKREGVEEEMRGGPLIKDTPVSVQ